MLYLGGTALFFTSTFVVFGAMSLAPASILAPIESVQFVANVAEPDRTLALTLTLALDLAPALALALTLTLTLTLALTLTRSPSLAASTSSISPQVNLPLLRTLP